MKPENELLVQMAEFEEKLEAAVLDLQRLSERLNEIARESANIAHRISKLTTSDLP